MYSGELTVEVDHLARMVKKDVIAGLAELVWNGLDAEATTVTIVINRAEMGAVDKVVVTDNGHGFGPEEVDETMSSVGGSWKATKADRKTKNGNRLLHGSKGEGRFHAFAFGDSVFWESVTLGETGNCLTEFIILRSNLKRFEWSTRPTNRPVGTTVTVRAGSREPKVLTSDDAPSRLLKWLALYLTQYPDVSISFNGHHLDPALMIDRQDTIPVDYYDEHGPLEVSVIEWSDPGIKRALFLCDANGAALHQLEAGIRAPGFNFTAYARWDGFRSYEDSLLLADTGLLETADALRSARSALRSHFRARALERSRSTVEEWRHERVYPYPKPPADDTERAQQALFNYIAVAASEAVNSIEDHRAKALSLQTMKVAVAQDPGAVEVVFREVLALPEEKLNELSDLLTRTTLVGLVTAMTKITGRLRFLVALEKMLFDPDTAPKVLERAHLQGIIGAEPWLFGEEYALHVSDRGLTRVLEAHLECLGRSAATVVPVRDPDGRVRRVDFMFGRSLEQNRNRREHLVVEIKRPTSILSREELNQIEDYTRAVTSDNQFDFDSTEWNFFLIGNDVDEYVHDRSHQPNKPKGLALELPDRNARVWVKRWSTLISDARHRLKFVKEQLEYDPSTDDAVSYLQEHYPDYVPRVLEISSQHTNTSERRTCPSAVALHGSSEPNSNE